MAGKLLGRKLRGFLLIRMSLPCPLLGVKRTCHFALQMSAFRVDPHEGVKPIEAWLRQSRHVGGSRTRGPACCTPCHRRGQSGATGCAAPRKLLATLEAMSPGPADLEFVSFVTTSAVPEEAGVAHTRYRHRTFFVGSDLRGSGQLDYVPISLEDVPELLIRRGDLKQRHVDRQLSARP